MSEHVYDSADGGICMKCDRCRYSSCCEQLEECDDMNWEFLYHGVQDYAAKIRSL